MKKATIVLILTCFTMCKQKVHSDDVIFVDIDRPEISSIFDYFRSIELIPLETSSDALIADISKIIVHGDRYYMLDQPQQIIFVFDQNGKFLFKINKQGKGPEEYLSVIDININPFTYNLELLDPYGPVHIYDLKGNYIETKRIAYPKLQAVHQFAPVGNHSYVFYAIFQAKKIIYFNIDEKKLQHEEFEEERYLGSFASNSLYKYQDEWYFFRPIHPVVYKIGKEQLEPAFQFDFGAYTQEGTTAVFSDEALMGSLSKRVKELFAQFPYLIHAVRHNSKYVFATLSRKDINHWANIIYDKSTGKTKYIIDFSEKVLFNSHRGEEVIVTDEYVLMSIQWVDLEDRVTKEMLDDENKDILEKVLKSKNELNPILIKYWFK